MNSSLSSSNTESSALDVSCNDYEEELDISKKQINDDVGEKISKSKQEFNKSRKIIIKNIPPVTYEVC